MWRSFIIAATMLAAIAADSDMSFTCNFERDTCGFTNQEGLVAQWERREMELDGKNGFMMVIETNSTSVGLGKMITPYFELDNSVPGCLSFDLYTSRIPRFAVEQEINAGIFYLWVKNKDQKDGWEKPRIDVNIDESTRFFFQVIFDGTEEYAMAAVDNVKLELKKC